MQITRNTTGMPAGLSVAADKDARNVCVVVVKGTFGVGSDGQTRLADEQAGLVYADEHFGDPAATGTRYECDFAPVKPKAEVVVNGSAVSPSGHPVAGLPVALEVGGLRKQLAVFGDRVWCKRLIGFSASDPEPFVEMPVVFGRAFGGVDQSHPDQRKHGAELRNPIGVGFHKPSGIAIDGSPLPNVEDPARLLRSWSDTPPPAGFGVVGRGWQPRVRFAGTYDERWLEERFPYLPEDFDERYFLCAPQDQWLPGGLAGQSVRCLNMTPGGSFEFRVPSMQVPVLFRFHDRKVQSPSVPDTLLIEPGHRRFSLTWRACVPLGNKLTALREVVVGMPSSAQGTATVVARVTAPGSTGGAPVPVRPGGAVGRRPVPAVSSKN